MEEQTSLLERAKVEDISDVSGKSVLCVRPHETVGNVVEQMSKREVLSVPVYADETSQNCTAFFDFQDLLSCLAHFGVDALPSVTMQAARNHSKVDVFWPVEKETGVYHLAEIFTRGVHRCPVVEQSVVVGVVSQSSLMAYIAQTIGDNPSMAKELDASLKSLGIITRDVVVATNKQLVSEALRTMHLKVLEALPVVDDSGKLLGSIAYSSLRGVKTVAELARFLDMNVAEFCTQDRNALAKSVMVKDNVSLAEAVLAVAENRCHRLIVIDDNANVKGIVSLGDLTRAVLKVFSGTHKRTHH